MAAIETQPVRARRSRVDHLLGGLLGVGVILLLWGHAHLASGMRTGIVSLQLGPWAIWALLGLHVAFGILVVVIVLVAPRLPMLPTVAAAVLVYGALADPLSRLGLLPTLGPWQPRVTNFAGQEVTWDTSLVALMLGAMTAAAVWGWFQPWFAARRA